MLYGGAEDRRRRRDRPRRYADYHPGRTAPATAADAAGASSPRVRVGPCQQPRAISHGSPDRREWSTGRCGQEVCSCGSPREAEAADCHRGHGRRYRNRDRPGRRSCCSRGRARGPGSDGLAKDQTGVLRRPQADRLVLRMRRARPIGDRQHPALHSMNHELAHAEGIPQPPGCLLYGSACSFACAARASRYGRSNPPVRPRDRRRNIGYHGQRRATRLRRDVGCRVAVSPRCGSRANDQQLDQKGAETVAGTGALLLAPSL